MSNSVVPAQTIDDVISDLDTIIRKSRGRGTADGYFAALYRRVTARVKERIAAGEFDDSARMERLDVAFANRYLEAWERCEANQPVTDCWAVALGASRDYWPIVLQHLLLGMNAHINLDLGIAAAEIAPGDAIGGLKADFDRINDVLASMVDDVQDRLASIWPAMGWLDRVGGRADEVIVNFSIERARDHAWHVATTLARTGGAGARESFIRTTDATMADLGRKVRSPGLKLSLALAWIRIRERGSVATKLDVLSRGLQPPM